MPAPPDHAPPRGPDWWLLLRAFVRKGRSVAAFTPSSRFLARQMVEGIDFAAARCVVELGAGTGPVTAHLAARCGPATRLVVVELDPLLCGRLKDRFPYLDVIQGDAADLDRFLADRGITRVDHVCSGLPLPSFSAESRDRVLAAAARALAPGGTFRQLTVMPLVYRRLYRRYFDEVRFRFVPANLPPGGVYVCRGYRPQA